MKTGVSRFRRVTGGLALAVLLGTLLWLAFHWAALPDVLPLRMNLGSAPTVGSKARLLFLPPLMALTFLAFWWTERAGVLNMPDLGSPERNRAAAREASAGLRLFATALLAGMLLSMVATSDAAPPGMLGSFFVFVGGAGLTVWLLSALRRR